MSVWCLDEQVGSRQPSLKGFDAARDFLALPECPDGSRLIEHPSGLPNPAAEGSGPATARQSSKIKLLGG